MSPERREIERRICIDPLKYTTLNPAQLKMVRSLNRPGVKIVVCPMGNGTGKTFGLAAIASAIFFGTANPIFANQEIYSNWPYPKAVRFCMPTKLAEDGSAFQKALKALFPRGRYTQKKGSGKGYYSQGATDTGFTWDVMTYNQDPKEAAGDTFGAVFFSEPPPRKFYSENYARTRAGGILFFELTPLSYAAWVKDELVDVKAITDDQGTELGKILTIKGDIHDNCRDCFEGGQLPHDEIMRTIAGYPAEEREARRTGGFMHLAGLIYRQYGDVNEIDSWPTAYHEEMFDKGKYNLVNVVDPHDRKPFAIGWYALFPNDDVIAMAEYPEAPFHAIDHSDNSIEDYRTLILKTEKALGKSADWRLIDPNFGNTQKAGTGKTVKELFAEACEECEGSGREGSCQHRLTYLDPPDSIADGHLLMRTAIGNPKEKKRPKFYVYDYLTNHKYGYRHYGYKESLHPEKTGLSEQPMLIHKDFPDLGRYLYNYGAEYRAPAAALKRLAPRRRRANA